MEEIKVGKYGLESKTEGMLARTTNGIIGIIINANEDEMMNGPELKVNEKIYCVERDSIKEIKENIIDLIECGDYVNGYKVISVDYDVIDDETECIELDLNNNYQYNFISVRQIKSIVTHEQFEQNSYKV